MKKVFNLQDIIKEQCDREAEQEWATTTEPKLPSYSKPKVVKNQAGWVNFFSQLRP